jgi:hypothetical protein
MTLEVRMTEDITPTDVDTADDDATPVDIEAVKAKERKLNRENATLRARAKAAEEKADKWDEFELSQKSEVEKVTERLAAAEKLAADLQANAVRTEVAMSKGLTAAQAKRLSGSTREELESDADELLSMFSPAAVAAADEDTESRRPVSELRGGPDPTVSDTETDPLKLADRINRRP